MDPAQVEARYSRQRTMMMTSSETTVFESIDVFRKWDEDYYPPSARRYYDRAVAQMLEYLHAGPDHVVLDAGCGPGEHVIRVARAGCRVHAIDVSVRALEEAQRRVATAGVGERVTFARADLTRLPYANAAYRHIFCWGVVIHIPEIETALRELSRILQRGGRLALYVTNAAALDYTQLAVAAAVLRRRQPRLETGRLGTGCWYEINGNRLWVWRLRTRSLVQFMAELGMRLCARRAGSLTELHRRFSAPLRDLLLYANNWYYRLHLPAAPCVTQLLVFEKSDR